MANAHIKVLIVFLVVLALCKSQDMNATSTATTVVTPTLPVLPTTTTATNAQNTYKRNILDMLRAIPAGIAQACSSGAQAAQNLLDVFFPMKL